ncbi:protein ANTAGONIST OF LIKE HETEROCHROMATIN PROTEIN 1 isoform X2 [Salarias fasciatus]|uniref:protein ANTAGONIST OF LIKE HETEROCHROMATIN PROTEIN 1 isoform X2 n=1 Tax=Salarias fasciatus TaxID=181472 RepID=UPI0011770107|nr:protein ANTAGONIST OF LIKE HETEROCHROMATIN PROTEIN 1-like isoform X2 [Salarias fasciatus]
MEDRAGFRSLLQMNAEELEFILNKVAPLITKMHTKMRRAITAKERLALTLRFLATGESFSSLSFQFRVGESTISMIVSQTCEALHRTLHDEYLKTPNTEKEWLDIAQDFLQKWQFPHCLGAIDGKHITIQPLAHTGSTFRNYKGRFSVLLLAVVDAKYQFKYVNLGAQGRASDAGVFAACDLKQALDRNLLSIPAAKSLPGSDMEVPFVFLGDDAYSLRSDLMKPFPFRQLDYEQRIFNYRLSRGRRVVENGFGILANRWRVFLSTIALHPDKVQKLILACVCLHNYLREVRSETYTIPGLADTETTDHRLVEGLWRNDGLGAMLPLQIGRCGNNPMAAKEVRDKLKTYFVTPAECHH